VPQPFLGGWPLHAPTSWKPRAMRLNIREGSRVLRGIEVMREGRVEPLLHADRTPSGAAGHWFGIAVEEHFTPPCVFSQHTHIENFIHVVSRGSIKCEVRTRGNLAADLCENLVADRCIGSRVRNRGCLS
jgi:hypothetical protein